MSNSNGLVIESETSGSVIAVPSLEGEAAVDASSSPSSEPPSAPVVFQCIKCSGCIGDSIAMVRADEESQTITLSGVSNIRWSGSVFTSKGGHDVGNTYFAVNCANCEATLGKYYLTTSSDLDYAREKFTIDISSIKSFLLGKPQYGSIDEGMLAGMGGVGGVDTTVDMAEQPPQSAVALPPIIATLEGDLTQVQEAVVGLLERVNELERNMALVNDELKSYKKRRIV